MNTTNDELPPYGPIQYFHVSHNDIVYPEDALMNKPTERAPLLSDEVSIRVRAYYDRSDKMVRVDAKLNDFVRGFTLTLDEVFGTGFYENDISVEAFGRLIFRAFEIEARRELGEYAKARDEVNRQLASGELRVVKKVVRILNHMESNEMGAEWPIYTHEGNCYPYFDEDAKFCPGCGAQIVKP